MNNGVFSGCCGRRKRWARWEPTAPTKPTRGGYQRHLWDRLGISGNFGDRLRNSILRNLCGPPKTVCSAWGFQSGRRVPIHRKPDYGFFGWLIYLSGKWFNSAWQESRDGEREPFGTGSRGEASFLARGHWEKRKWKMNTFFHNSHSMAGNRLHW